MLTEASDVALEVRSSVTVQLPRDEAFHLFTEGMGRWWPLATHSVFDADATNVILEPRVGGRLYEEAADGRTCDWGSVTVWEPGERIAMTWHPGDEQTLATLVEVTFGEAPGGGTLVDLRHTGWDVHGPEAEEQATSYQEGWPLVLASLVRAA